jgi:nitroreductase
VLSRNNNYDREYFLQEILTKFRNGGGLMEYIQVVEGRRSVRVFAPELVPEEDIKEIIRIGTLAPSAGGKEDWRFLAVVNQEVKRKMKELVQKKLFAIAQQTGHDDPEKYSNRKSSILFADAPLALVVLTKPYRSSIDEVMNTCGYAEAEIDYLRMRPDLQTIGGVIHNILLAAYTLGYGSCWMVAPNIARHELEQLLGVSPPWSIAAVVAIGRPAQKVTPKKAKKAVEDILEIIK